MPYLGVFLLRCFENVSQLTADCEPRQAIVVPAQVGLCRHRVGPVGDGGGDVHAVEALHGLGGGGAVAAAHAGLTKD